MKKDRLAALLLVAVGLALLWPTQTSITQERLEHNYRGHTLPLERIAELPIQDLGIVTIGAILGGFRSIAVDLLWMKSDSYWHEGKSHRMVPIAKVISLLEPHFVDCWVLTGWHLAYNMSVEADSVDQARQLIRDGIAFLIEGAKWNPERHEIPREIGWTYFDKLNEYEGKGDAQGWPSSHLEDWRAAEWLIDSIRKLEAEMRAGTLDVAIENPPTYLERLIAHGYERMPDIDKALEWYHISLDKYGDDHHAVGAIKTITERYVRAWALYRKAEQAYSQERYSEAIGLLQLAHQRLIEDWQKDDPYDLIGMHLKAKIHEFMAVAATLNGDMPAAEQYYDQAFNIWLEMAEHSSMDKLARRRLLDLFRRCGRPERWAKKIPAGLNDVGLPETTVRRPEEMGEAPGGPAGHEH